MKGRTGTDHIQEPVEKSVAGQQAGPEFAEVLPLPFRDMSAGQDLCFSVAADQNETIPFRLVLVDEDTRRHGANDVFRGLQTLPQRLLGPLACGDIAPGCVQDHPAMERDRGQHHIHREWGSIGPHVHPFKTDAPFAESAIDHHLRLPDRGVAIGLEFR